MASSGSHPESRPLPSPREWSGAYLDGRTAARHRVTVRLLQHGLHIATDRGHTLAWPYNAIRVTQGTYAGEQIRIEHGGPIAEVLFIADPDFLAEICRLAPGLASRVYHPARRKTRIALTAAAAVATIALVAVVFRWGIPLFAALVTPMVPVSWEDRLGAAVVEHMAPIELQCDDAMVRQRLDEMLAVLTAAAPSPYTFRLIVMNDDTINAFAAPGGHIVVLRGLLTRTSTPEELVGVLAHEAQHVIMRHSTRALLQHASAGLLVGALTGDVSGVATFALDAARTLGLLRYSRDHEREADEAGMRTILNAGIDPSGMIAFFDVLARDTPTLPDSLKYLSTHPATADRVARIKSLAAGASAPTTSFGSPEEWATLKMRCGGEDEDR